MDGALSVDGETIWAGFQKIKTAKINNLCGEFFLIKQELMD